MNHLPSRFGQPTFTSKTSTSGEQAEPMARMAELMPVHTKLHTARITNEAKVERCALDLGESEAEATKKFDTSDEVALAEKKAAMVRFACELLDTFKDDLDRIEAELAEADADVAAATAVAAVRG